MADLTTVAVCKDVLNIPSATTTADAAIAALVSGCSVWVENETGRMFAQGSVSETRSGRNNTAMALNRFPVSAITSLTINGVAIPARTSVGSAGYYFANDVLYLDGGLVFTKGQANVVVGYTAGFAAVPADIAMVTAKLVGIRYREKEHLGQLSKTIQGETVSFDMKDLPADVKKVLDNYQSVVWGA